MPTIKLTAKGMDKLKPGEVYFDTETRGFCVRVTENGVKTFSVVKRVRGLRTLKRFTLGKYHPQEFPLGTARDMAKEVIHEFNAGKDPTAEKKRKREEEQRSKHAETFGDLVKRFLADQKNEMRESTHGNWSILLNHERLAKLRARRTPEITTHELKVRLDAIRDASLAKRDKEGKPKPGKGLAANRTMEAVRRVFSWAMEKRYIQVNPFVGIAKPVRKKSERHRRYSDDELGRIMLALGTDNTSEAIKLCLYTGCRVGLALGTPWKELDLEGGVWTVPIRAGNKVDREWLVPLVPAVVDMLKARQNATEYVFPIKQRNGKTGHAGRLQKDVYGIRKRSGVDDFTPHDLRRTLSTWLSSRAGGATPYEVRRALLGHVVGGIEGTYDLHEYEQEKREALERWANHVSRVTEIARANAEEKGKILHMPNAAV